MGYRGVRNALLASMAYSGARRIGSLAAGAVGYGARYLYGKLRGRKAAVKVARRRIRRRFRRTRPMPRMKKTLGFGSYKIVRMMYRGASTFSAASNNAVTMYKLFQMGNCMEPLNSTYAGNHHNSVVGYNLYKGLYKQWVVLGSKLSCSIRCVSWYNKVAESSGTSSVTQADAHSVRWGIIKTHGTTITGAGYSATTTNWPAIAADPNCKSKMLSGPVTLGPSRWSNIKVFYSPRRFHGFNNAGDEEDLRMDSTAVAGSNPTEQCNALLWLCDNENNNTYPATYNFECNYTMTFLVKWIDLYNVHDKGLDQQTVPS